MQLCLFEAFWARLSLSMDSDAENTYELSADIKPVFNRNG